MQAMRVGYIPLFWLLLYSHSNLPFAQDDPLEYVRILESAERVRKLQVERVVELLNAQPGDRVADLGAGSGLFTRPLATKVGPEGVVYAIDINEDLLEHIDETAKEENLENITPVLASQYDPNIPEKVDLILICNTLHQIDDPGVYLSNLVDYLKEGGRVAIIDYDSKWPQRFAERKYSTFDLDAWMAAAGYQLDTRYNFLEDNFFIIYRYRQKKKEGLEKTRD
jgi:ubiquinone/menaquinone biosynthesis C-methylase UbiE